VPIQIGQVVAIACDNPACPGNDLSPGDRAGWLFVTHEVYGEPVTSSVYCSTSCVAGHTTTLSAAGDAW
jgi:hypothetical protein